MESDDIARFIAALGGVDVVVASAATGAPEVSWGDSFFFYNPDRLESARQFPFATIVTKDYAAFDTASNLNRPGVYRLNIGLARETYADLFSGHNRKYDFAAVDQLLPHPVYGPNHWVCVLNPSDATFERLKPLLAEAHGRAVQRYRPTSD